MKNERLFNFRYPIVYDGFQDVFVLLDKKSENEGYVTLKAKSLPGLSFVLYYI